MELKELYQEIILDHAKNPRNKGKCDGFNHDAKAHNALCGDKVHIYLNLDKDKTVKELNFEGEGCAISLASASILTDTLEERVSSTKKIVEEFLNMLKNKNKIRVMVYPKIKSQQLILFLGQRVSMRIKCATMAWHTFYLH